MDRAVCHCRIAISVPAAEDLFGPQWREHECVIIYSGRDLSQFTRDDACRLGEPFGFPPDALVLSRVGRVHWPKNHDLVIEVADALFHEEPGARLILVGDGTDEEDFRAGIAATGIADRVVFACARDDVPRLMAKRDGCLLVSLPSRRPGRRGSRSPGGGVAVHHRVRLPAEVDVVPDLITRLPLSAPPMEWASAVLNPASAARTDPAEALQAVLVTDFNIEKSVVGHV